MYRRISLADVNTLINNPRVSRRELNDIAIERFHVTASDAAYGTKKILIERIKGWMEAEKTLETIERLASNNPK